ncbi:oxygenase MpaB family protein [Auraticoccus monumenti]|uniref:Uncharacterized conserved protein, DUF2236 family n=1 Tax=Auraticoccus monumenti TaxID=675864 RepID=A0A1G6SPH3_9ACTN|nr:oxygenase MpaB family protein [Auraticoccus monumenti]SDD18584.1 Uncharacterized conserved protein, DUF2236 family [Auraticoccus monumenti]
MIRARVAGEDAQTRARRIWDTPGERWFTPEDPVWRVHSDASMFPGGVAALLLQSLHPLAMAGVAGHSGYRGDPWGRLQRTSDYLATTTFGTVEDAERIIARVRDVHTRVRGKDERGRPYRADDPVLLSWVHVAEVESFLAAHQAYGAARLTPAEADRYVAQAGVAARLLGVPDPPTTVVGLAQQLASYRAELEPSPAALDAARFLLREPPLPRVARPGYAAIAAGGVALLPDWARVMLDDALPPVPDRLARPARQALGRAATATVRWAMAGVD